MIFEIPGIFVRQFTDVLPVNSSEFSMFPRLFKISLTPIMPKANRAPRPTTTP
jgi:hypothetical protein